MEDRPFRLLPFRGNKCGLIPILELSNTPKWKTTVLIGYCLGTEIYLGNDHGGNSKGTTCVVDRDVTAYLVVDRVLRFPTEQ